MKKQLTAALMSSVPLLVIANTALSQEASQNALPPAGSAFSWEGALEIGLDAVHKSNTAGNEIRDVYAIGELAGEAQIGNNLSIFAGLTWESVTDPTMNRSFDDMGLYIDKLGLQFSAGNATYQIGKIAPTFGNAWDNTVGFYATTLAEDYELAEQIGGLAEVELGTVGLLSLGVFFADTSGLSKSAGFNRGRNTTAAGGAGNTGKLDNAALQWSQDIGATSFHAGARYLSAGIGDVSDETGVVIGIGHSFSQTGLPLDVFAEIASFDGFGGTSDTATYATLNAAYAIGDLTLSGVYAQRDITSSGKTSLLSLATEYAISETILIGGAIAHIDEAGVKDDRIGLNIIFSLGS